MSLGEDEIDYEALPTSSLAVNLMAGALAGITEHSVMYPMDSIKTRMQVLHSNVVYTTVTNAISRISTTEGLFSLWRGVSSVIVGAGPAHALYFATYEKCKVMFGADGDGHHPIRVGAAGACATIAADGLMNPFDGNIGRDYGYGGGGGLIKQRMQMQGTIHRSMFSCASQILKTEGFSAFYISYPTALSMTIPYQSIHFATYEYFRKTLNPSGIYDPKTHMLSGGLAGAIAAAATTPLDVCRTLLQTRGMSGDVAIRHASGLKDAARIIYASEGWKGFMRGIRPRILSHMPSTAICWTTVRIIA
ncbi:hypothetical protein SmJEL517_g02630 [Synchytrium microbalum]|uniref:Mitochondrial thiamine pyrophosphate carrier 1 n=1 Tax=Synchytrium microbalum TaxID=1806994 RepID=A0A507CBD8_9FUNG|nr:uncharacterized protein SmJEL517_g02630 [Synchytrium microbalum]TPX34865.1 hypothetical protein SmJEL517_g02630 [Synchytrium microbalum]